MNAWGWEELRPWLELRPELPVGALFCVITGTTCGRHWSPAAARAELRRTAAAAGVRRRFAPHQLRHAHAVEMAREGVPLIVIQRQLGYSKPRDHFAGSICRASTAARSSKPCTGDERQ
jgi:site-specific recombinase XerD